MCRGRPRRGALEGGVWGERMLDMKGCSRSSNRRFPFVYSWCPTLLLCIFPLIETLVDGLDCHLGVCCVPSRHPDHRVEVELIFARRRREFPRHGKALAKGNVQLACRGRSSFLQSYSSIERLGGQTRRWLWEPGLAGSSLHPNRVPQRPHTMDSQICVYTYANANNSSGTLQAVASLNGLETSAVPLDSSP